MKDEEFFTNKLGEEKYKEVLAIKNKMYEEELAKARPHEGNQKKIFKMLLDSICMYRTLQQFMTKDEALQIMEDEVTLVMGPNMKKMYEKIDHLPGGFGLFKFGFTHVVPKSNLWDADISKSKDEFDVTMKRCFWHDTFNEYGCPELCPRACRCDEITYGGLTKSKFSRTETLGTGGKCCDFKFKRVK